MEAEALDRVTDLSSAAALFEAGVGRVKEAVADAVEDGIATTQRSLKQARQVAEDLVDDDRTDRVRADQAAGRQLKHEWAVILAGGDGTRLRSLTRRITGDERPKQFCPLIGQNTLLAETRKRVALEVAKQRTMFVVNRAHERYYSKLLGRARRNVVEQPCNIGTAPAILYSILKIASVDPEAIVAFFPSDHYVSDDSRFMPHVRKAFEAAHLRPDLMILLGIEPESPETEYGWIEPGQSIQGHKQLDRVRRFWEKPSSDFALVLQLRGCLWNSFVMVASARTLLDTIATATPALYQAFAPITPFLGTDDEPTLIENVYALQGEINFSQRVLALVPERLAVLRVRGVKWSDLGEPNRAFASIQTAGARPRWIEKC